MSNDIQKKDNVFRSRNFRLVFLGALVSDLGATLYSFAVSLYILEISGNNAFLQGLYLALGPVPYSFHNLGYWAVSRCWSSHWWAAFWATA